MGHIGNRFFELNDPTNIVKALKEIVVLKITLQSEDQFSPHHVNNNTTYNKHRIYVCKIHIHK